MKKSGETRSTGGVGWDGEEIRSPGLRVLFSPRAWVLLWLPVLLVTGAHYLTSSSLHQLHDIYRRLYYIPILLAAFNFGLPGALAVSLLASLVYLPHAFTFLMEHDPAHGLEKILEILMYNVVALITGILAARETRERRRQQQIAARLNDTLEEKRDLEEQLIRAGRLSALAELTAGLAHEIKNPLASIKGASEIIADEVPPDSPRRRMVEIQKQELDRLHNLLERFLSFARPKPALEAGFNVCELLEHIKGLVESRGDRRGIGLELRCPTPGLMIQGDWNQLSQVVLNLVLNALDASPAPARVTLVCRRETLRRKPYAVIEVSDQGPGVPPELRDQIFNPFFTTKESGTGLGLAIASRIVDQHRGFIKVDANPQGPGACFSVWLPDSTDR